MFSAFTLTILFNKACFILSNTCAARPSKLNLLYKTLGFFILCCLLISITERARLLCPDLKEQAYRPLKGAA